MSNEQRLQSHWCFWSHWDLGILWSLLIHPWSLRGGGSKRNMHAYQQPSFFAIVKLETMRVTVKLLEAGSGVRHADSFVRSLRIGQPIAIVAHFQEELSILAPGAQLDLAWPGVRFNAVLDGIFHQGLQDQIGHARLQGVGGDVHAHREAVAETSLFNVEVTFQKIQFLAKWHFMGLSV